MPPWLEMTKPVPSAVPARVLTMIMATAGPRTWATWAASKPVTPATGGGVPGWTGMLATPGVPLVVVGLVETGSWAEQPTRARMAPARPSNTRLRCKVPVAFTSSPSFPG